jgi:hypothetical protein
MTKASPSIILRGALIMIGMLYAFLAVSLAASGAVLFTPGEAYYLAANSGIVTIAALLGIFQGRYSYGVFILAGISFTAFFLRDIEGPFVPSANMAAIGISILPMAVGIFLWTRRPLR